MKTQQDKSTRLTCRSLALFRSKRKELAMKGIKAIYAGESKDAPEELKQKGDLRWLVVW